ncbi:pilin [Nocardia carnea]|uniref:pilin n=1 Tax=Nocardia carnea TaxID=37328 RepID=UPI002456247F|nr:pilin [Nocardia carnea]
MRMIGIPNVLSANPSRQSRPGPVRRAFAWATALAMAVVALVVTAGAAAAEPVVVLAIAESFDQVLDNIRNWLVGILAGLATVCLTVGGARYVLASGDPGEVEKSKTALRAACIGYGLAMLAPVIVAVLKSIVGA